MFTLIYLFIRAFVTGVKINGYGDFRSHLLNCLDIYTFIFWAILVTFWVICVHASKYDENEEHHAVERIEASSLIFIIPLAVLASNEKVHNKNLLNSRTNNIWFGIAFIAPFIYLLLCCFIGKKFAKGNIFFALSQFLFYEALPFLIGGTIFVVAKIVEKIF